MDIFDRPHAIAEDTIQYTLYPPPTLSDKTSATTFAACITTFVDSYLPNFVWNRDGFEVKIVPDPEDNSTWVLEGRMRVGDCVDDEWFTVWLLKQVSSKWDVVISVYDSDGQFLLIEAAEALPSWVKPANSDNRVWIYNSRLHLIPLLHVSPGSRKRYRRPFPGGADSDDEDARPGDDDTFISAEDAVKFVRDPSIDTYAPPDVEKIVWQRIAGYPDAAKNHVHSTKAYLPIDIAKALTVNPSLIQKAVETFYTRDGIQLRAAHRMSRFPPKPEALTHIKMTRTAYAQLLGQKFFPPKIFGHWTEQEGTNQWRWRDVGMKIAIGFEILYQESKGRQNLSRESIHSASVAAKETLQRNPEYQKYIENLKSADYFKGEIQGSELWNSLENKAAAAFVEVRRTDDATRQPFASQVDAALTSVKNLPDFSGQEEDSDEWLHVDAGDFDHMLESTLGKPQSEKGKDSNAMDVDDLEDRLATEQAAQLKTLAGKVESFVEGEGDLEGARFEDEEFSDEPFSDDETTDMDSESEPENSSKEKTLEKMQAAMDKLVPALEPSDYGKMPASYHSNSQRVAPAGNATDMVEKNVKEDQSTPQPDAERKTKPLRPPIIPRDKYDGVDSDDETDEEDQDDESEEEHPQVVGEIEIDMEEEEEEFLEFSREALGISNEQWEKIVMDRKDRGAFLPSSASKPMPPRQKSPEKATKPEARKHVPRVPEPGPRPNVNPELDSFETVMKALDEALLQSKKQAQKSTPKAKATQPHPKTIPANQKGKQKATVEEAEEEEEDFDIEAAMEAELRESMEDGSDAEEPVDYNMIKNFLESYKSQAGLSGPVSNLAGRLQPGLNLPRDGS
ncbi:hypothetical protein M413DRAFT_440079 [Hebeloma cylindrosporum]|uniref:SGT1-domain-containing protein n=1 Tax=Hebeloma cylindrosporum TaxID=76867 RepID=A0A0C3CWX6_HEBCY|nr:hypothetical protein M413DRAFT_440079 [Hebeloma cylindrosporum h7]